VRREVKVVLGCLAALTAVAVSAGCGSGNANSEPTAKELYAQQIQVGTFSAAAKGMDPDELDRSGADVDTSVRQLGQNRFELTVQNISDVGFVNSFWWHASNLRIVSVTSSSGGTCRPTDANTIQCQGMTIAPPKCTCLPGGSAWVRFVAKPVGRETASYPVFHGVQGSRLRVGEMTPVPYHIASFQGSQNNADLPLCAKGRASTRDKPCVHAT
jgi:hypothetical protein